LEQILLAGSAAVTPWCEAALRSSKYVIDILDHVLDQSKLEQGKLILDSKVFNLKCLCESVQRTCISQA
jgi:hypothetical protein